VEDILKHIYLMLLLLLLPINAVHGQDEISAKSIFSFENNPQSFDNRIDFSETFWQPDSQSFSFRDVVAYSSLIYHYDVPTNRILTDGARYSCTATFTDEQAKNFDASYCPISTSPNMRYVIYATNEFKCRDGCAFKYAIGDPKTGKYIKIQAWIGENYYVRWSENSSAFLIMSIDDSSLAGIWYVSVPQILSSTTDVPGTLLSNFPLGDIGYVDISPDGQQVLVRGNINTYLGLTLWSPSNHSTNQQFSAWSDGRWLLKDQNIGGATFLPDDPQRILVVTDKGILNYNLKTDTSTIINTQIKGAAPDWVYFSPDVRYALSYTVPNDGTPYQKIMLYQLN
jgi:hypothetical protein